MEQILREYSLIYSSELAVAAEVVAKRLEARGLRAGENGLTLKLTLDSNAHHDSWRIVGKPNRIEIIADSLINVFAGCGDFLRDSCFEDGGIIPSLRRGLTVPDCEYRMPYWAHHYRNFYESAPLEKIQEYLEDTALMGSNVLTICAWGFDPKSFDGPDAVAFYSRVCDILRLADRLGMGKALTCCTNLGFYDVPDECRAAPVYDPLGKHGQQGNRICISNPVGVKYLDKMYRFMFGFYRDMGVNIDYVQTFPYDEGGCGCEKCMPWGGNGYIRASKHLLNVFREYFPGSKAICATWTFDTPPIGEWDGLAASLENEKWCDIIMADSHEAFPRYPLDVGVPGNLPMISFPEISMWGSAPWGGFGATAFPRRMTKIWQGTEGKLSGHMLYSEGIYEDLNKAVISGLCVDFNTDPELTVTRYAGYEFGCREPEKFIRMIDLMEENMTREQPDIALADEAYALSCEIEAKLPLWGKTSWRWRMLAIRVLLDMHRYRGDVLADNPETLAAMHEVIDISCLMKTRSADVLGHDNVRPPCPDYE